LDLFARRAYDEISIDDIAESAGISKGLLYHYFEGKRGFYVAVVEAAAASLVEGVAPDTSLPPPLRARAGLEGYLDFVEAHASAFVALMRGGIGVDPQIESIVERTRMTFVHRVLQGIGVNDRPAFHIAARAWIGGVEAASLEWAARGEPARSVLVEVLLGSLAGALVQAARLDPAAGVRIDPASAVSSATKSGPGSRS
jgi:AcrR family transcriptional regulator